MNSSVPPLILTAFVVLATFSTASAAGPMDLPEGFTELTIGDAAPDFTLPGVDGKTYTLKDFSEPDVLMIYFTGTHCPTSHGVEQRLQSFVTEMKDESFQIVAINPNHSSGLRPDEFGHTEYDESFEGSKRYAEDLKWTFPFLYDGDKQITAREYGCLATPHVFIFDKDRKLRYNGRFDDSRLPDPATVTSPDAVNAVKALLAGEPVPVETTRPHGCSTKWKERAAHVAEEEAKWQAAKVEVAELDAKLAATLRKNGTGKVRLINVWATWCAPCVHEMPDLTEIAKKFSRREFELITISLDSPEDKDTVREFLGKCRAVTSDKIAKTVKAEGRTTNNYLYTGASTDALAKALDPEWPGPVPYTLLIDAEGEVVYRKVGVVDPDVLRRQIMDTLTTYHTTPMRKPTTR
ncbi:MAG: redoxin domain-containing protein [Verrucomicrobiales bacterium]|nr:redoxin domain-containing protein [Verrucomicrobiales bacterium]